ncbi:hypothetical protein [Brevibacterium linens]|uniref:hypothetical protein n=1 Tax=Brevibacterium linens TaxID=1703 RepID=UPI003BF492C6
MATDDTIGVVEHEGTRYQIGWPRRLDNPFQREDFGVVYKDGKQIADFSGPDFNGFTDTEDVMESAREFISDRVAEGEWS